MPIDLRRACRGTGLGLAGVLALTGPLRAEAPLSAIDWLSQSVTMPAAMPLAPDEPPVSGGVVAEPIMTTPIDGPSPDGVGLLPATVSGLPRALWGPGETLVIAAAISAERVDGTPALQSLLMTLLLAEAEPPADSGSAGVLLLARIDKLLAMGALDQADALLKAAEPLGPELFRRRFDVALLTGDEDRACETMRASPNLAPTFPARVFCLARSGDWNAAALTLRTAQALGFVTPEEDALLSRFLDPELSDGAPSLTAPPKPTPLVWRMFEAIGEPLPTQSLPIAFAHAELRDTAGWKAQLEAAERLARAGAIAPNLLLGLYTERDPAASGGVWDRVAAFQDFDAALTAKDPARVAETLPKVWAMMVEAEIEVPFATLYADALGAMSLEGAAGALAFRVGLLAPGYGRVAAARTAADPFEAFLIGLARGDLTGLTAPDSLGRTIAPAFLSPAPAPEGQALLEQGRIGEALLMAIDAIATGVQGDPRGLTAGLSLLRLAGQEDVARRVALELMLLERRG